MAQLNWFMTRGRRWAAASLGMVALAGGCLFVFRGCSSVDAGAARPAEHSTTAQDDSARIEIPKFGRPEEAKRYFDAMTDGDQRSLQLLEQALAAAHGTSGVDPNYVAELERDRALRVSRLKAYREARGALGSVERAE